MSNLIAVDRWQQAQTSEQSYWDALNVTELLRIYAEKPEFLNHIPEEILSALFVNKSVLEIGCGPLGIVLASFFRYKDKIAQLVKVEPFPYINVTDTRAVKKEWTSEFVAWVLRLSNDGVYIQKSGEYIIYQEEFDTVVTYHVLKIMQKEVFRDLHCIGILG